MANIYFGVESFKNSQQENFVDFDGQNYKNNLFNDKYFKNNNNNNNKSILPKYKNTVKKLIDAQEYNYNKDIKNSNAYYYDYMYNDSGILISPYLEKNIELYVWDWDDTLIDIDAYMRHSMNPEYIINELPEAEFNRDFPNSKYFKELVMYLQSKGKGIGIASFGTYSIIKAYMDRLFGSSKNLFHSKNMFASCQDIGCVRDYTNMPTNKNSFIRKIMDFYDMDDYQKVVLFDDRPTNIADAARLGILGVQIGNYDTKTGKYFVNENDLFGPDVMSKVEDKILQSCSDVNLKKFTQFGSLGERKITKYSDKFDHYFGKELKPNFKTEHFKSTIDNSKPNFDVNSNYGAVDNMNLSKEKQQIKKLTELKGKILASHKARLLSKKNKDVCDNTGCYGFFDNKYDINKLNNVDVENANISNRNNNMLNKKCQNGICPIKKEGQNVKEGFDTSCYSCQSQASSLVVLFAFLILVLMIVAFCYFG